MANEATPMTAGEASVVADGIKQSINDTKKGLDGITQIIKDNQTVEELRAFTKEFETFKDTFDNLFTSLNLNIDKILQNTDDSEKRQELKDKKVSIEDKFGDIKAKLSPSESDVANGPSSMNGFLLLNKSLKQMFGLTQKEYIETGADRKAKQKSNAKGGDNANMFKSLGKVVSTSMSTGFGKMDQIFGTSFKNISDIFTTSFGKISNVFSTVSETMKSTFGKMGAIFNTFGKFGESFKGLFGGKDKKEKGGGGGLGGAAGAGGILVLASNITDVGGYISEYNSLVKESGKMKGISIKALEKTQASVDKFTAFLDNNFNKDKKEKYEEYKEGIAPFIDTLKIFSEVGMTVAKIVMFIPVFMIASKGIGQIGKFVDASATLFNNVNENLDESKTEQTSKSMKHVETTFSSILKAVIFSALVIPFIIPGIIGITVSKLYINQFSSFLESFNKINKKQVEKAALMCEDIQTISTKLLVSTVLFAVALPFVILATASLGMLLVFSMILIKFVERFDSSLQKKLSKALACVAMVQTLAVAILIISVLFAIAAIFVPLAIVGLLAFVGLAFVITIVGKIAKKAMSGILAMILLSIAMVLLGVATLVAIYCLAKAGNIIINKIGEICLGIIGFLVLSLLIAAIGYAVNQLGIIGLIALGVLVAVAVAIFAVALYVTVACLAKIEPTSILMASLVVITSALLFAAVAVAAIPATLAAPMMPFLLATTLILLVAALPLWGAVTILSKIDPKFVLKAALTMITATLLFAATAIAGAAALLAVVPSAAIAVTSLLLFASSFAINAAVKNLSEIGWKEILESAGIIALTTALFAATILAGGAALLALVPAAMLIPTSLILAASSKSIKEIVENYAGISNVLAATGNVLLLTAFFGAFVPIGIAALLASKGIKKLSELSPEFDNIKNILPTIDDFAKITNIDGAKKNAKGTSKLLGSVSDIGKVCAKIMKNLANIIAVSFGLRVAMPNLTAVIKEANTITGIDMKSLIKCMKKVEDFFGETYDVGKDFIKMQEKGIIQALSGGATELKAAFENLSSTFNSFNEVVKITPSAETVSSLRTVIDEFSHIKTKGLKSFGKDLSNVFGDIDKTTKPIDKLTSSIRGLNEELKNLNSNGNAVKMVAELNSGKSRASIRDAKLFKSSSSDGGSSDMSAIEGLLEDVNKKLDKFFKMYENNNKQVSSWKK